MWRSVRRIFAGFLIALPVAAAAGWTYQTVSDRRDLAHTPAPGRLIDVGTHRLHIWCMGSGTPAVVMDAGLGATSFDWHPVQPEVAAFTQTCAFDRAGMGYSDAGPSPRTSGQIAKELGELLSRSGIGDPVVLVGASFGGLDVRMFASRYPDRAAGLVLVDASHEDQGAPYPFYADLVPWAGSIGLLRLLGVTLGFDATRSPAEVHTYERATMFLARRYRGMFRELVAIPASAGEVKATRHELNIPVVVVTGGRGLTEEWNALQRDQLHLSKRGCQMIAERSGHRISRAQPEAVVRAIRTTWEAARSGGSPTCT